jgi:hypothetical protein
MFSLKSELKNLTKAISAARPTSHFYDYYSRRLREVKAKYLDKEGPCDPPEACCFGNCQAHNG